MAIKINNPEKAWYITWFDSPYYHLLYDHRDDAEAANFINRLIKYLQPAKNAKILDLACGMGRHAYHLAKKDFLVTGIDLSKNNIDLASKINLPNLSFDVHDMRNHYKESFFDYVFNFFTSFGYFETHEENMKAIKAMHNNLCLNGILMIDFLNIHKVTKRLPERKEMKKKGMQFIIKKEFKNGFLEKDIQINDKGKVFHFREKVCGLTIDDFINYFEKAGMKILTLFGDYKLRDFNKKRSDRLIIIAQKVS